MSESDGALRIVKTVDDAIHCFNQDKMAVCIHFEGAEPIAPNLSNLDDYYASGLRSVGISRPNAFAYGVPIEFPGHANHGPGLSSAPLVATHSNAHSLCASSRNLTD